MARVALIFLFAFCVFQLSAGTRVVRDAESASEDAKKVVDDVAKNLNAFLENMFKKENMEKIQTDIKAFGDKLMEEGNKLKESLNEKMNKINEPTKS